MARTERGMQFAKNIRVIDWLKTEVLDQIANLFKGLHHANQNMIIDSLSSLLVTIYVLSRRMGLPFRELDQAVTTKLREHVTDGHQLEQWYGDLSSLEEYLRKR